jgi:hypothetical protein
MPRFNIDWSMAGTAVVEADDLDEAESIMTEAMDNWDSSMLDEVDVDSTSCDETNEIEG